MEFKKFYFAVPPKALEMVVSRLKVFLEYGFPCRVSSIQNAAYQMLVTVMCCPRHVSELIRKGDLMNYLRPSGLILDQPVSEFFEPSIPLLPCTTSTSQASSMHDLFILKRFVFAVDRETGVILYPLPPFCVPKESALIDKITVVILFSPRLGLGPGLIVFPHSILNRQLRLSLGETGNLGKNWAVSAHQRGGLTQSMMVEFMNGEGQRWLMDVETGRHNSPKLAVDWWFCIELNELDVYYKKFTKFSLPNFFPSHQDPFDICLGVTLTNMWGLLIRKWKLATKSTLVEEKFPQFIHKALNILCEPNRLQAWCDISGLQPADFTKSKQFVEQSTLYKF